MNGEIASVCVGIRVKPPCDSFNSEDSIIECNGNKVSLHDVKSGHGIFEKKHCTRQFVFDKCFPPESTQEEIYQRVGAKCLETFYSNQTNCSIIAYGQTGSGKTFTMLGTEENRGLIPRICEKLLSMESSNENGHYSMTFFEIYNEKVYDLLVNLSSMNLGDSMRQALRIRQHPTLGPYVEGLHYHPLISKEDVEAVLRLGCEARSTGQTHGHAASSRSHAVCTLHYPIDLHKKLRTAEERQIAYLAAPKLHLVDLAGSEKPSHHCDRERAAESSHINKSLATLGNVILALSAKTRLHLSPSSLKKFVPYRNSTLTWLLRDSLGGSAKTIMIGTISSEARCRGETLKTLRYAYRARNILSVSAAASSSGHSNGRAGDAGGGHHGVLVQRLRAEIRRLSLQLLHSSATIPPSSIAAAVSASPLYSQDDDYRVCQCGPMTGKWTVIRRPPGGRASSTEAPSLRTQQPDEHSRSSRVSRSCMTSPVPPFGHSRFSGNDDEEDDDHSSLPPSPPSHRQTSLLTCPGGGLSGVSADAARRRRLEILSKLDDIQTRRRQYVRALNDSRILATGDDKSVSGQSIRLSTEQNDTAVGVSKRAKIRRKIERLDTAELERLLELAESDVGGRLPWILMDSSSPSSVSEAENAAAATTTDSPLELNPFETAAHVKSITSDDDSVEIALKNSQMVNGPPQAQLLAALAVGNNDGDGTDSKSSYSGSSSSVSSHTKGSQSSEAHLDNDPTRTAQESVVESEHQFSNVHASVAVNGISTKDDQNSDSSNSDSEDDESSKSGRVTYDYSSFSESPQKTDNRLSTVIEVSSESATSKPTSPLLSILGRHPELTEGSSLSFPQNGSSNTSTKPYQTPALLKGLLASVTGIVNDVDQIKDKNVPNSASSNTELEQFPMQSLSLYPEIDGPRPPFPKNGSSIRESSTENDGESLISSLHRSLVGSAVVAKKHQTAPGLSSATANHAEDSTVDSLLLEDGSATPLLPLGLYPEHDGPRPPFPKNGASVRKTSVESGDELSIRSFNRHSLMAVSRDQSIPGLYSAPNNNIEHSTVDSSFDDGSNVELEVPPMLTLSLYPEDDGPKPPFPRNSSSIHTSSKENDDELSTHSFNRSSLMVTNRDQSASGSYSAHLNNTENSTVDTMFDDGSAPELEVSPMLTLSLHPEHDGPRPPFPKNGSSISESTRLLQSVEDTAKRSCKVSWNNEQMKNTASSNIAVNGDTTFTDQSEMLNAKLTAHDKVEDPRPPILVNGTCSSEDAPETAANENVADKRYITRRKSSDTSVWSVDNLPVSKEDEFTKSGTFLSFQRLNDLAGDAEAFDSRLTLSFAGTNGMQNGHATTEANHLGKSLPEAAFRKTKRKLKLDLASFAERMIEKTPYDKGRPKFAFLRRSENDAVSPKANKENTARLFNSFPSVSTRPAAKSQPTHSFNGAQSRVPASSSAHVTLISLNSSTNTLFSSRDETPAAAASGSLLSTSLNSSTAPIAGGSMLSTSLNSSTAPVTSGSKLSTSLNSSTAPVVDQPRRMSEQQTGISAANNQSKQRKQRIRERVEKQRQAQRKASDSSDDGAVSGGSDGHLPAIPPLHVFGHNGTTDRRMSLTRSFDALSRKKLIEQESWMDAANLVEEEDMKTPYSVTADTPESMDTVEVESLIDEDIATAEPLSNSRKTSRSSVYKIEPARSPGLPGAIEEDAVSITTTTISAGGDTKESPSHQAWLMNGPDRVYSVDRSVEADEEDEDDYVSLSSLNRHSFNDGVNNRLKNGPSDRDLLQHNRRPRNDAEGEHMNRTAGGEQNFTKMNTDNADGECDDDDDVTDIVVNAASPTVDKSHDADIVSLGRAMGIFRREDSAVDELAETASTKQRRSWPTELEAGSLSQFINSVCQSVFARALREVAGQISQSGNRQTRSLVDSPPGASNTRRNPAMDNLYSLLMRTESEQPSSNVPAEEEEILNVTITDGVPYISIQPGSDSAEPAVDADYLDLLPHERQSRLDDIEAKAKTRSASADSFHYDAPPTKLSRTLDFSPSQLSYASSLNSVSGASEIKSVKPEDADKEAEEDSDYEELIFNPLDTSEHGDGHSLQSKAVSWGDLHGNSLEVGPSLSLGDSFDQDRMGSRKPIIKKPALCDDGTYGWKARNGYLNGSMFADTSASGASMRRTVSVPNVSDVEVQTEEASYYRHYQQPLTPVAALTNASSMYDVGSPGSTDSYAAILRHNSLRLLHDLKLLVRERDKSIANLRLTHPAAAAGTCLSRTTQHYQQQFRDKLLKAKVELDIRIDEVWYRLKSNGDLSSDLTPAQQNWLLNVFTSADLTLAVPSACSRQLGPAVMDHTVSPQYHRLAMEQTPQHTGFRDSLQYRNKLVELRHALIGAYRKTDQNLTADTLQNCTGSSGYYSGGPSLFDAHGKHDSDRHSRTADWVTNIHLKDSAAADSPDCSGLLLQCAQLTESLKDAMVAEEMKSNRMTRSKSNGHHQKTKRNKWR